MRQKSSSVYLAVDLGGTNSRAALVSHTGKILKRIQTYTPVEKGAKQILDSLCQLIDRLLHDERLSHAIQAIGIGSPGCINIETGTVLFATNNLPGWKGTNIKHFVETQFKLPVFVDNDANTAAYGEKCCGTGRNVTHFIALTIGTGVGGGIIIQNEIYRGYQYYAGEIGHITINDKGPICNCGNRGCLEAYISAHTLVKNVRTAIRNTKKTRLISLADNQLDRITPKIIYQAASMGDKLAQQILTDAGYYLGVGLSSLINLFSPEKIAIGGGIAQAGKFLLNPARQEVKNRALFISKRNISIVQAQCGPDAGLIGAALLAKKYIHA